MELKAIRHVPVLVEEAISFLNCRPHGCYVDATLGTGGHALEILKRTSPDGVLVGIDWDEEAIAEAKRVLMPFKERVRVVRDNFVRLPEILASLEIERVDGILLDLGLSSLQLENKERGFSFAREGPLDMRMDRRSEVTAAELINRLSLDELEKTLEEFGEERWARRIAQAICKERARQPIETTEQLRRIVHESLPARFRHGRIDPATKTFQAFRIRLNRELDHLRQFLQEGWRVLAKGGRLVVISFHSLEDRLVKEAFRRLESGEERALRIVTKKPIRPSPEERRRNPRSRSARLRCAERI